jgi:hypothetical protein
MEKLVGTPPSPPQADAAAGIFWNPKKYPENTPMDTKPVVSELVGELIHKHSDKNANTALKLLVDLLVVNSKDVATKDAMPKKMLSRLDKMLDASGNTASMDYVGNNWLAPMRSIMTQNLRQVLGMLKLDKEAESLPLGELLNRLIAKGLRDGKLSAAEASKMTGELLRLLADSRQAGGNGNPLTSGLEKTVGRPAGPTSYGPEITPPITKQEPADIRKAMFLNG